MTDLQRENIIIAADDFGISSKANRNILKLIRARKIDRVSVMVCGEISPLEISELKKSKVKLDIHLESVELKPEKRKLKDGIVRRSSNFLFKYLSGKISAPAVEISWEKQIRKFKEIFGKFPDGINSHQHIHFWPAYFKIILKLVQKFEIPYARFGKFGLAKSKNNIYRILNQLHKKDNRISAVFDSSDFLVSLDWIKNIEIFLKNLPQGETEVVCHPEREEEFEIIMNYF
jgi:predicted glycoside hydrolase/deacetylase ChbG (UPF0249 family)